MRKALAGMILLLITLSGCGEMSGPPPLMKIADTEYGIEDFRDYLEVTRPSQLPPYEQVMVENYLRQFMEHRLLLRAADDAGTNPGTSLNALERDLETISNYLGDTVYQRVTIDEEMLMEEYDERYTENRVRIRSIFFNDQRTAQREYQRLRGRPRDFERMMDEYNTKEIKELGMGQGVFTRYQMPDDVRDAVFKLEVPGIVGPIELDKGYIVVEVIEFLDRPELEEVRAELEEIIASRERSRLRTQLIERLMEEYNVEMNPDVAFEAPGMMTGNQTGTEE